MSSYSEITSTWARCMEFLEPVVNLHHILHLLYMYMYMYIQHNTYTMSCAPKNSGRHSCLYCTITSEAMRTPVKERGRAPLRSLDTLASDHLQFQTIGKGNLKNAKHYNNVIGNAFFDIPLSQVSTYIVHYNNTYIPVNV